MSKNIEALFSNFELIAVAGLIALLADLGWLGHDVYENGMSIWYGLVGLGLSLGIIITAYVVIRHNLCYSKHEHKRISNYFNRNY